MDAAEHLRELGGLSGQGPGTCYQQNKLMRKQNENATAQMFVRRKLLCLGDVTTKKRNSKWKSVSL